MSEARSIRLPAHLLFAAVVCLAASWAFGQPLGEWRPVGDSVAHVAAIQVAAAEPSVVLAIRQGAVWRLEGDQGSWQKVDVPEPQGTTFEDGSRSVITSAAVSGLHQAPHSPGVVFVTWLFDYLIVDPDGTPLTSNNGSLALRTADGGETWHSTLTRHLQTLSLPPTAPLNPYAVLVDVTRHPTVGPLAVRFDSLTHFFELAPVDPDEPSTRYVADFAVDGIRSNHVYAIGLGEVLVYSEDSGATWQPTSLPETIDAVAAHPVLADLALAADADSGAVWRTTDGGASWQEIAALPAGGSFISLSFDPVVGDRYYAVAQRTPYASDDDGASWTPITAGLPAGAGVFQLAVDPADPSRLFTGVDGDGLWMIDRTFPAAPCVADATTLCLGDDGRFEVRAVWHDFFVQSGVGRARPLDSDDTGAFWFFKEENLELIVKVLDGRPVNGRHWVFYGALTNLDFTLVVTDTTNGETVGYHNPLHRFASRGDVTVFPEDGSNLSPPPGAETPAVESLTAPSVCIPGATVHCLNGGRFQVEVEWEDFTGGSGDGNAVPVSDDTGLFWFFRESNLELAVKVLDGRPVNGDWWVFYGALTNVAFRLTVTDTATGEVRTYENPSRNFASRGDTEAFDG